MAEMRPEEVPAELVRAAMAARWDLAYPDTACRSILAAALPLHEQQMRDRVADDIEAWAEGVGWYEDGGVWADAIDVARTGRRHADEAETEGGDRG